MERCYVILGHRLSLRIALQNVFTHMRKRSWRRLLHWAQSGRYSTTRNQPWRQCCLIRTNLRPTSIAICCISSGFSCFSINRSTVSLSERVSSAFSPNATVQRAWPPQEVPDYESKAAGSGSSELDLGRTFSPTYLEPS